MKPVVALDIDDVLLNTMSALFGYYNKVYGTSLTEQHYYTKDVDALGVSDYAEAAARFEDYLTSTEFKEITPLPEAVSAIKDLNQYFAFIAVTSRPFLMQEATASWLEEHFGPAISQVRFTHFIMTARKDRPKEALSKIDVCKEINAQYMIEDHLYHAVPVAEAGIKVFLINQPWNQTDVLPVHAKRVAGWKDIERQLGKGV